MAHVLLIEPDTVLARTYREGLDMAGHSVDVVANAQAAIDAADGRLPDVVVLELQLPAHNGIEFLYEFRSYPEWRQVPVIVHSLVPPHEFQASSTLWNELGVDTYYYKPRTSLRTLLQAVTNLAPAVR